MQSGRGVIKFTNISTDQEMESFITDVIGAVVLFVAMTLMYLHVLKLIFGIKQELTQQSQIIQSAADNLQKSLLQLAEKTTDSTPDWQREDCTSEALTPRSIYPESCISDGSMNTVIHVILSPQDRTYLLRTSGGDLLVDITIPLQISRPF